MSAQKFEVRLTYPSGHVSSWDVKSDDEARTVARYRLKRLQGETSTPVCEILTYNLVDVKEFKL